MPAKRVYVAAENGETLRIEGDLLLLIDAEGMATLFRTVETYIEPSQGIIDKWMAQERPFHVDPNTHFFRFLEEIETRGVESEEDIQQMLRTVPTL